VLVDRASTVSAPARTGSSRPRLTDISVRLPLIVNDVLDGSYGAFVIAHRSLSLLVVSLSLLVSCQPDPRALDSEGTTWAGNLRDSAGVTIVTNAMVPTWTRATYWTVEKDLTIGVLDGSPEYEFGRLVDAEEGPGGRIYVLDQMAAQVRVFDSTGTHVMSFGQTGQGPGEFSPENPRGAQGIYRRTPVELFVPDRANNRGNHFTIEGEFRSSFRLGEEQGSVLATAVLSEGDLVLHRASGDWRGLLRVSPSGEVVDTVHVFSPPPTASQPGRVVALRHAPVWTVTSEDKVLVGVSDVFRLELRTLANVLERVITTTGPRSELSSSEQERFLDQLLARWAEMFRARGESEGWIAEELRKGRQLFDLPTGRPQFTRLLEGPQRTIWAQGALSIDSVRPEIVWSPTALPAFASSHWYVFSREGRYLGLMTLPDRFWVFKIRGLHIYGVETGELDIQQLVRLRIVIPT